MCGAAGVGVQEQQRPPAGYLSWVTAVEREHTQPFRPPLEGSSNCTAAAVQLPGRSRAHRPWWWWWSGAHSNDSLQEVAGSGGGGAVGGGGAEDGGLGKDKVRGGGGGAGRRRGKRGGRCAGRTWEEKGGKWARGGGRVSRAQLGRCGAAKRGGRQAGGLTALLCARPAWRCMPKA